MCRANVSICAWLLLFSTNHTLDDVMIIQRAILPIPTQFVLRWRGLARTKFHPRSLTTSSPSRCEKGSQGSDFAWGPRRHVASVRNAEERNRAITANYLDGAISPPMPYGASSWKGPTVLLWHLLLPLNKTLRWDYLAIGCVVSAERIFRIFRNQT